MLAIDGLVDLENIPVDVRLVLVEAIADAIPGYGQPNSGHWKS